MRNFRYIFGVSVSAALALSSNNTDSAALNSLKTETLQPAPAIAQSQNPEASEILHPAPLLLAQATSPESSGGGLQPQLAVSEPEQIQTPVLAVASPSPAIPVQPQIVVSPPSEAARVAQSPAVEAQAEVASVQPQAEAAPIQPQNPASIASGTPPAQVPGVAPFAPERPSVSQSPDSLYLDPDANPLLFPTRPEEVRLEGTQPLTLEQALELARRNNQELQVARLEYDRARAVVRQALAAEYPTLTLQGDASRQQSPGGQIAAAGSPPGGPNPDAPTNTLSGTLQLSYDLYTGGLRSANIRAAERQQRVTELEVERLGEQLRLDVTEDYYNLQEALEQIRIRQQSVNNALRSLQDAQALEQAGVGTRFAVLQAQVQFANEQQRLTEAIAQLRTARRQLARRLSIPQFVDLTAADPVQIAGRWELPLEDSIVLAFQNRAELEQQLVQRELNEAQRRAALSARNPRVSLFANYNVLRTSSDDPLGTTGTGDGYTLGARVNWNLFDGGEARARARQEEADIAIAETNFANNRNLVRLQVEQSYFELVSTFENIQTASIALEQAREALRLARLRFQAGVGTQTEVIDAETDLTLAEFNRIQAILGYNRSLARLQRAISNFPGFATAATP
ncbi:TolC family protein [Oscillatoria amoena NRMC-F 0135]|nr:TolC family protein [Geitlerinema splendidum]MDL5047409.1 TolC family protein [Oscillatoria amoena NRMC-F 0135]